MSQTMNKHATKHKRAMENSMLKFLTVSSVSSDSIVKEIIDDIVNTAVKTAEVIEFSVALLCLVACLFMFLLIFNEQRVPKFTFVLVLTYYVNLIYL
jgi:Ca2+/Na+ antiporter